MSGEERTARAKLRERGGDEAPVLALPVQRDDEALVAGLRAEEPWAQAALFDRYAPKVERILRRLAGGDADVDVADLVHDTFVQAFVAIGQLDDPKALERWLQVIATRTAYRCIRRRQRRRWLCFWEPERVGRVQAPDAEPEMLEAYRRTQAVLAGLPARERVPFTLRFVEGMELKEVAELCECSLATVKRRLARGQERFVRAARKDEILLRWLERGARWEP